MPTGGDMGDNEHPTITSLRLAQNYLKLFLNDRTLRFLIAEHRGLDTGIKRVALSTPYAT